MNTKKIFAERLEELLKEKRISQRDFADAVNCSRQSINFYVLGKRLPDISVAASMAECLGVSCDYLIGKSDIRTDKLFNTPIGNIGITASAANFFMGLNVLASGKAEFLKDECKKAGLDLTKDVLPKNKTQSLQTLNVLNKIISHKNFKFLAEYIKIYNNITQENSAEAEKELTALAKKENKELSLENFKTVKDFCKYLITDTFEKIINS